MPFFAPCFRTSSRIASKNKNTQSLVICDNVIPHVRKPGDKLFTKYFFNVVKYFITMSQSVHNDLFKIISNPISKLLFHPIYSNFGEIVSKDESKKKLKIPDEKIILFFGFIRDYKGLDTLLDAMKIVRDKFNVKLLVAGEFYSNEKKYLEIINNNHLDDIVILHNDFIPSDLVKYYFCASDAVILPYKSATQSGIVQIANNFNKPLIGTDTGGLG